MPDHCLESRGFGYPTPPSQLAESAESAIRVSRVSYPSQPSRISKSAESDIQVDELGYPTPRSRISDLRIVRERAVKCMTGPWRLLRVRPLHKRRSTLSIKATSPVKNLCFTRLAVVLVSYSFRIRFVMASQCNSGEKTNQIRNEYESNTNLNQRYCLV